MLRSPAVRHLVVQNAKFFRLMLGHLSKLPFNLPGDVLHLPKPSPKTQRMENAREALGRFKASTVSGEAALLSCEKACDT